MVETHAAANVDYSLILRWQTTQDEEAFEEIKFYYDRLIKYVSRKQVSASVSKEEALSIGYTALVLALRNFDTTLDSSFAAYLGSYVQNHIRNACRDYLRLIKRPRSQHTKKDWSSPEDKSILRLDKPFRLQTGEEVTLHEHWGEEDTGYLDIVKAEEVEETWATVRAALRMSPGYDPRWYPFLRLYFVHELSQREVARLADLSQMHVSRLMKQALSVLRRELRPADHTYYLGAATRKPPEALRKYNSRAVRLKGLPELATTAAPS